MTTSSSDASATAPDTRPPKRRLRHWTVASALVAAVVLAAAGCGGSGDSKSSTGSTSQGTTNTDSAQQSGIAYAQCMRSHGVTNFPDNAISTSGGATKFDLPQGIASNPDYQSASQACQSKLPRGANGGSSSGNTQAELNFAACMRSHGVPNFPEPNSQGAFRITSGNGLNPNSPTFQSAMQACRSKLPNGGAGLGS